MQEFHTALRVTLLYAAVTAAPVRAQDASSQTPVVVANPEEMRPVVIPGILLSQDGRVWIRLAQAASGDARTWAVHGADGQVQRTYELPADVTLMDAGRDWILGTFRDELDVTYVGLWRLPT